MCFHYALSKTAQSLKNRYQLKLDLETEPLPDLLSLPNYYISGFDYPQMPVITNKNPEQLAMFHWGLIPSWIKTPAEAREIRTVTLNARSESVFTKPSFRKAIRQRRCLIPADGFYEWRLFEGKKYPYFIYLKNKEIFSFAGIWEEWADIATGEVIKTYSIITTGANPLLEKIHNTKKRMPVILEPNEEKNWLSNDLNDERIAKLMKPLDESLMEAYTISKLITSRTEKRNTPNIQKYTDYPELSVI